MTDGSTFRSCRCISKETGKELRSNCPELAKKNHGQWWARYSAPRISGKRRQPRLGPFPNETEAKKALRKALSELDVGLTPVDRNITFGNWLDTWISGKKSLAESTMESYIETIELYGKPGLGHLKLVDVREEHLSALYDAIGQINNLPEGGQPGEMLRRLLAVRAPSTKRKLEAGEKRGRLQQHPLSAARIQRIHRVLSSAFGTALKQKRIQHNPAEHVELPKPRRVRPLVWTPERVARWQETGEVPGPVMVWTPVQAGSFFDFTEDRRERLHPLFHLTATRGLRRGEVVGSEWVNTDLDGSGTLSLLESEDEDEEGNTLKSESSWRTVALDATNIQLLKTWRRQQRRERLAAGEGWIDSGRIFTRVDGSPLRPDRVSQRFGELVFMSRLPPIRFHDLRHCAATMMLAAGADMKVISATLGHKRYAFTADTYASVVPEVAAAEAEATVAIIPRRARGTRRA